MCYTWRGVARCRNKSETRSRVFHCAPDSHFIPSRIHDGKSNETPPATMLDSLPTANDIKQWIFIYAAKRRGDATGAIASRCDPPPQSCNTRKHYNESRVLRFSNRSVASCERSRKFYTIRKLCYSIFCHGFIKRFNCFALLSVLITI